MGELLLRLIMEGVWAFQNALRNQGKERKVQQDGSRQQDNKKQNYKQIHSSILSRWLASVPWFKAWHQRFYTCGQPQRG
jgi:hypothetical protein